MFSSNDFPDQPVSRRGRRLRIAGGAVVAGSLVAGGLVVASGAGAAAFSFLLEECSPCGIDTKAVEEVAPKGLRVGLLSVLHILCAPLVDTLSPLAGEALETLVNRRAIKSQSIRSHN